MEPELTGNDRSLTEQIVASTLASLKRRNLASADTLDPTPLVGLDKPSNSSFIPPEYFAVNCIVCSGAAYGFSLTRNGSGVIQPNQNVYFTADASWSYCFHSQYYEDAGWVNWPHPFSHVISSNGGYVDTLYSSGYEDWDQTNGEYLEFALTFSSTGTKTVEDILRCEAGCPNNIFLAQAQRTVEVVCAVPTNFHQDGSALGVNGLLHFEYAWDSSTGNLQDLSACTVGEIVTYPNGDPYVAQNPPFDAAYNNPTVINVSATAGSTPDDHMIPGFTTPYSPSSHTGTQNWRYSCPCANSGQFVNLMGPLSIHRQVSQNPNGTWKYTVTKPTAGFAAIDPLP